ncbi:MULTISPECIES: GNAT family N-acetyltransferase [Pseudofrankia]|uniref:GNAT family N-acetyltransferase n=1 Tax=Pseudofrankia TaxID=2994363 RepID=UPI000234D0C8|nr:MULTISPECIES: GNAT family N-acetyltransferase [Pseudofrankia]OHV34791.1 hypothetical protein BCD49_22870 [Pseudofrankia sp. EUN1h]
MTLIRAARPADMAAVRGIAAGFDLLGAWPSQPDFLDLERETGRLVVADVADVAGGVARVVGFAGALTRGGLTHLGDLFIDPGTQSAGLGRRLLEAVLPGPGHPVVTFASSDPRALSLYLRQGLRPRQPLWYLGGGAAALPDAPAEIRPATADDIAELDAEVSGGHRVEHLAWYLDQPGVAAWRTPGGYAVTRVHGDRCAVGPAGGHDADATVRAVLAAAREAAGSVRAARSVHLAVFAAHSLAAVLVGAGFRITDQDTFMATPGSPLDTDRYVPDADLG